MDLRWYFDFVSPFAYLHWQKLKALPKSARITPVPVVLGALLGQLGNRGPAEIPAKRVFTYRHVLWQARQQDTVLRFPPMHPFNSLAPLRLCLAVGNHAAVIDAIFDWIWRDGRAADSALALAPLAQALGVEDVDAALADAATKAALRANTDAAIATGVFGVPTLSIDGELFWGNEAHGLAEAVLADPDMLHRGEMARAISLPALLRKDAGG